MLKTSAIVFVTGSGEELMSSVLQINLTDLRDHNLAGTYVCPKYKY